MIQNYSPHDFLKALRSEALKNVTFAEGMIKVDEKNMDVLLFTATGCDSWTSIPIALIDTIDYIKYLSCKDHEHPFVRIHFKQFESPESKMLASLLSSHTTALKNVKSELHSRQKPGTGFCQKFCSACDRCDDPDCDACVKCRECYQHSKY